MEIPLGNADNIRINQRLTVSSSKQVDASDLYILLLPESAHNASWSKLPYRDQLRTRYRRLHGGNKQSTDLQTDLPNSRGSKAVVIFMDKAASSFELLNKSRKALNKALHPKTARVIIQIAGLSSTMTSRGTEALITALLAASVQLPSFKSAKQKTSTLSTIDVFGLTKKIDLRQTKAGTNGNHLARWLSILPGNKLTPKIYHQYIKKLARQQGWTMRFLDTKALKTKKAGAFLAVSQGSPNADAGIVHLVYKPKGPRKKNQRRLALVGKGICFDTGGVNVKPAKYMNGMQEDMQGSAVALGTLLALTELQVDFHVDCWLALAENHVGPKAYKPGDVVTASNGTSIEVIHTDAEGRMVLADTLSLASSKKPDLIIDYATLTGACVYSLSSRYSGAFTNHEELMTIITRSGKESGERVWPFPLDADFDDAIASKIADVKQCTLDGEADHILAARFLQRFIAKDDRWIHIDLASGNHKGGLGHIPSDTTGFGVRFTLELLLNQGALN